MHLLSLDKPQDLELMNLKNTKRVLILSIHLLKGTKINLQMLILVQVFTKLNQSWILNMEQPLLNKLETMH